MIFEKGVPTKILQIQCRILWEMAQTAINAGQPLFEKGYKKAVCADFWPGVRTPIHKVYESRAHSTHWKSRGQS
jgi:hypothetical protein